MSYLVQARLDDHTLSASTGTAKEAFEKAIEWQARERFDDVTISRGADTYSIDEFASVMARLEIARTINDANKTSAKANKKMPVDQGWQRRFEDPIPLADGRLLVTNRSLRSGRSRSRR